jgi:ABC-type lipoprotein release transport system permease subunit
MTRTSLILRNLVHFRWANLAVIAGMAVATAVLTGALMVGDSVRGSLRQLALRRLGPVDHALVAGRFVNESLADRVAARPEFARSFESCVPGILLRGGVSSDNPPAHAAGVQTAALRQWMDVKPGEAMANAAVAEALGLRQAGRSLLVAMPSVDEAPRDALAARRGRAETIVNLNVRYERPTPSGMASLFNLAGGQRLPRNLWVNLAELQIALDRAGGANLLLVSAKSGHDQAADAVALTEMVRAVATLDDYGLEMVGSAGGAEAVLVSRATYILPAVDAAAARAAEQLKLPLRRVSTYLANSVELLGGAASAPGTAARKIHYALAAGVSEVDGWQPAADEVAINQWTAQQLGAKVGDRLRLTYYLRQPSGQLVDAGMESVPELRQGLRIARVLPMSGLGADNSLTPNYKGLTDASSIADWNPPEGLNIDKKLVTHADEEYWKKYRAAPKLLMNLGTAQKLWGAAFGSLTSLRLPAEHAEAFGQQLARQIEPASMGLSFRAVKAEQLAAATGGTDFSGLFIGFSFFLIVAAALLLGMLMRLSVEQRARQWGLLAALGFAPRTVRRLALAEGMVLALIGGLLGLAAAVGYTALMVHGLRTWWVGAVGTSAMTLHVLWPTLGMGLAISLLLAWLTILWAVWRVGVAGPASLLSGNWGHSVRRRRWSHRAGLLTATMGLVGGAVLIIAGASGRLSAQVAFMSGGFLLLAGVLGAMSLWLRPSAHRAARLQGAWPLERVGAGNAARHPARSVLTVSLIAFATFILITVASMRQGPPDDTHLRSSGAGGFTLILQADIPLLWDLGTVQGRQHLKVRRPPPADGLWQRSEFVSMRAWAGQDISCLNLTKPTQPTILSVPKALVQRGGFAPEGQNPFAVLEQPGANEDDIPVLADAETAQWILHLGIGQSMSIHDQTGRQRNLRLAGMLHGSIFQGELLMSEANFVRLFPMQSGFGVVLIDAKPQDAAEMARVLGRELADFSVIVDRTADRLAAYKEVANTYLSTFQALGALGLLLGTIGLAVVLLRSLIERRSELALLGALGFGPGQRLRMVLSENVLLLVLGLAAGAVCALVGVLPAVVQGRGVNLGALAAALGAILVVGIGSLVLTMLLGGRHLHPADLRAE